MTDPYHGFDPEFAAASDWARLYRANGVQIVPCKNKIPRLKSWKEYQNCLVPDAQFEAWYGRNGEFSQSYDMGMLTGLASGRIMMIDLDIYKVGGQLAIQWWQNVLAVHNNGFELETWKQHTGGGGVQMFFLYPPNWKFAVNAKTDINVDVRCQGGFAVLPPTQHASGRPYEWDPGCAPWELELAIAPDWLLTEVESLVVKHGGGTFNHGGNGQNVPREHSGNNQFDAFGHQTDGRETAMYRMVWRCVVQWRRQCPIKPSDAENSRKAREEYDVYERNTRPQAPHPVGLTLTQMLDAEGRGWVAWQGKWQYAMKQWQDDVAIAAKQPDPSPENGYNDFSHEFEAEPKIDPTTGQQLPLILTGTQFVGTFQPPDYLVDNMIQKGYLYSLTGPTGHGKTPVSMLMGAKVACGLNYHGKPVTQGGVLFLAGENSDDIRARYIALADHEKFDIGAIPFYFVDGVIDINAEMPRIEAEAGLIPNLSLVIIDTDQAYFLGDEGNSNEQRKWFAKVLRKFLKLPGNPAALVNCHPTKNASQDNLVPIGGSAFLNEVDGNITCWADDRTVTIKPHSSKWRGAEFESMAFELRTITSDRLKDTKGRPIPSVIAIPITEEGAARRAAVTEEDEKIVLRLLYAEKDASMTMVARRAGWSWPDGTPAKSKVQKLADRLKRDKLIYNFTGGKYRLTKKGCKVIGVKWDSSNDDE